MHQVRSAGARTMATGVELPSLQGPVTSAWDPELKKGRIRNTPLVTAERDGVVKKQNQKAVGAQETWTLLEGHGDDSPTGNKTNDLAIEDICTKQ